MIPLPPMTRLEIPRLKLQSLVEQKELDKIFRMTMVVSHQAPAQRKKVCPLFIQKKCPYGKKGRTNGRCSLDHPDLCFKFIKFGKTREGCMRGAGCKFHHPQMCWQYQKRDGNCKRQNCKFYHGRPQSRPQRRSNFDRSPEEVDQRRSYHPRQDPRDRQSYSSVASRNLGPSMESQRRDIDIPQHFLVRQTQLEAQMQKILELLEGRHDRNLPLLQGRCHCGQQS